MIFNKGAKIIQWGKEQSFQEMTLRQTHMQKNATGPPPHTTYKN